MKKVKSIIVLIIMVLVMSSLQAQKRDQPFDVEKHHKEQADFFAKELSLTDTEKAAFVPLMQDYIHARFELNKEVRDAARELMKQQTKTEADYQKVIDMGLEAKIKEAELQKEYFKKFGKVLPAEKIFKYNRAERKFMQRALNNHTRREKKEF